MHPTPATATQTQTAQTHLPATKTTANSQTRTVAAKKTMQAIVQRVYGSADVLELSSINQPQISESEVLIEVHNAGLDRGTWHLMTGTPYLIRLFGFGLTKPKQLVPGFDVAGKVVATGAQVTRFKTGDEVFGIAKGSFAEFAAASEDKLVLKPADLSFEAAAVATISGVTALEALTDVGKLKAGQRVLVMGASGGVGTYAVQLAKALGAEVTGVASAAKAEWVRSLGADHVIDYHSTNVTDSKHRYDLIIDIGGRNPVSRLRNILAETGTLVFVGGEGGNKFTGGLGRQIFGSLMSLFIKQRLTMFVASEGHKQIERLAEFIRSGAVTPAIGQRYRLEDAPRAIHELEEGIARGKSVIAVKSSRDD